MNYSLRKSFSSKIGEILYPHAILEIYNALDKNMREAVFKKKKMFFKWCVAQNVLNLFVHKIFKIYLFPLALPRIDTNFGTYCICFFQSYFQCWVLKDNIVRHGYPCYTVANRKDSRRQGASISAKQKWKGKWRHSGTLCTCKLHLGI